MVNPTPEQEIILNIFYREKNYKLRHWEMRSGDSNIYLEYLNGCGFLDNLITMQINKLNKANEKKNNRRNIK